MQGQKMVIYMEKRKFKFVVKYGVKDRFEICY